LARQYIVVVLSGIPTYNPTSLIELGINPDALAAAVKVGIKQIYPARVTKNSLVGTTKRIGCGKSHSKYIIVVVNRM